MEQDGKVGGSTGGGAAGAGARGGVVAGGRRPRACRRGPWPRPCPGARHNLVHGAGAVAGSGVVGVCSSRLIPSRPRRVSPRPAPAPSLPSPATSVCSLLSAATQSFRAERQKARRPGPPRLPRPGTPAPRPEAGARVPDGVNSSATGPQPTPAPCAAPATLETGGPGRRQSLKDKECPRLINTVDVPRGGGQ